MKKLFPTLALISTLTVSGCEVSKIFEKESVFEKCAKEAAEKAGEKEDCDKLNSKADELCESLRNKIAEESMSLCMTKETNMPTECHSSESNFVCTVSD